MTTDWKQTLGRLALATGRGLLWLARQLYALLLAVGSFVALRAAPAVWRGVRGTVLPAMKRFYLWLPHRRKVAAGAAVAVIAVTALVMRMPEGSTTVATVGNPTTIDIPSEQKKQVDALMSGDLGRQKAATKEILQQMGQTVLADDAMPSEQDYLYVIPPELTLLAVGAGQKPTTGHLSLGELASLMHQLDFPFARDQDPAVLLRNGVRAWVRAALEDPKQAGAEAPLFLYAMAAQQQPALDLSSDDWAAGDYHLTHLELRVFLAAFYQAYSPRPPAVAMRIDPATVLDAFIGTAHAEPGPCTYAKNYYQSWGERNNAGDAATAGGALIDVLVGQLMDAVMDAAGAAGKTMSSIMAAAGAIMKVQKLFMLYGSLDMTLTADPKRLHRPASSATEEMKFIAKVGVDEQQYKEHLEQWNASPAARGIKDCLAFAGLPTPADMSDIAGELDGWMVAWDLHGGGHAHYSLDKNEFVNVPQRLKKLDRISPTHGESSFTVDLIPEEGEHEGDEAVGQITGEATLHTDKAALLSASVGAGKAGGNAGLEGQVGLGDILGLGNAVLDVLSGWAQRMIDPTKYYVVAVRYHKHRFAEYSYAGTVSVSGTKYETSKSSGWIGFTPIDVTTHRAYNYSMGSVLSTNRSSFTPGDGSATWYLGGDATTAGGHSVHSEGSTSLPCIGGRSQASLSRHESGDDTSSTTGELRLSRRLSDEGTYRFDIKMYAPSIHYRYRAVSTRTDEPSGCVHTKPSNRVEKNDSFTHAAGGSLTVEFASNEEYPAVISGKKQVVEKDGTEREWQWNLIRIDPSDSPTYVDAVGG